MSLSALPLLGHDLDHGLLDVRLADVIGALQGMARGRGQVRGGHALDGGSQVLEGLFRHHGRDLGNLHHQGVRGPLSKHAEVDGRHEDARGVPWQDAAADVFFLYNLSAVREEVRQELRGGVCQSLR